jgi:hypothetical protein
LCRTHSPQFGNEGRFHGDLAESVAIPDQAFRFHADQAIEFAAANKKGSRMAARLPK